MDDAIVLRAPAIEDVPALVALQQTERGTAPPMNEGGVARDLFDEARGHGANVRVAVDAKGAVAGVIAWVYGGEAMFAAPSIAPGAAAAAALADAVLAEVARAGATSLRVSTGRLDSPRARALAARGFATIFDFVDVARPTAGLDERPPPPGLHVVAHGELDRARLLALYNATFEGVPNAVAMSPSQIDEILDGPLVFAEGTGVLADAGGTYVGFLQGERVTDAAGPHVVVEAVGVDAAWRGRDVGPWLIERLVRAGAAAGVPEARAAIASTNTASMRLHARLGFTERFRRHVWEWRAK